MVDTFAVLNVQLHHLKEQLRPLTQHYVIHPKSVNQSNSVTLPIMLSSRLLPEQERALEKAASGTESAWEHGVRVLCDSLLDPAAGPLGDRAGGRKRTHRRVIPKHSATTHGVEDQEMREKASQRLCELVGCGSVVDV